MTCTINNTQIKGLIDNGINTSFIKLQLLLELRLSKNFYEKYKQINYINILGNCLNSMGTVDIRLKIDGKTFTHTFKIINDLCEELIFGYDFISKMKIQMNVKNGVINCIRN